MKRAAAAAVLLVAAAAVLGVACGGGGGGQPTAKETQNADFTQLRDSLRSQLDSIGVNFGSVPDDVLTQILNRCHELEKYADNQTVNSLCDAIKRAHDNNDTTALDQIVAQLDQLKPK